MASVSKKNRQKKILKICLCVTVAVAAAAVTFLMERGIADFGLKTGKLAGLYNDPPSVGEMQIHSIDVGQADSTLIRCADGNILIDAGSNDSESRLRAHLRACGIEKLDYLICTHPHSDHIGGADMLIEEFEIGRLVLSDAKSDDACYDQLLDAMEKQGITAELPTFGTQYTLGDIGFVFLAPATESDDLNNASLAVKFTFGETDLLFTGDLEAAAELELLEIYGAEFLDCEFLKVGHHGSATASAEDFLAAVSPEIAAISCGKDNSYGHPRGDVIEALRGVGCQTLLRTDISGTSAVASDGKTLSLLVGEDTFVHQYAEN